MAEDWDAQPRTQEAPVQSDAELWRNHLLDEISFDLKNLSTGTLQEIAQITRARYWAQRHYDEVDKRKHNG
jgi:hypothetical protein